MLLPEWFRGRISEFKTIVSEHICLVVLCSKAISISGFFEEIYWTVSKKHDSASVGVGLEVGRYRQMKRP